MKKIFIYSVLIFIFSIAIGYYYSNLWKKEHIEEIGEANENKFATSVASVEEKVSFDANLSLKKYYNDCGHCKLNYIELPTEFINLTEKEIEEFYSDWRVEEFSENNIVLAQNVNQMCDEHFVLKLGESYIEVFRLEDYENLRLLKTTNISKDYLTNTDINNLEAGIYIYGVANLNKALEDFE